jgi:hypothetical protein
MLIAFVPSVYLRLRSVQAPAIDGPSADEG